MNSNKTLTFEKSEIEALTARDPAMGKLVALIGDISMTKREDHFQSLVRSCIGQQLSVKAAQTIYARFQELVGEITPEAILQFSDEELRSVGLSKQKIAYLRDLSEKVQTKEVDLDQLESMDNDQIRKVLTSVKGIGPWTAEMFLIFSLGRTNVLPVGDLGIQRACQWLYGRERDSNGKKLIQSHAEKWHPHYTAASLYLWEAINRGLVAEYRNLDEAWIQLNNVKKP
ncbi:DNA-3-methyladenine glycosylase family protein [Thalassobacillus sp. B23F22_16]|uniref:DNA-3-methyladenine glycosylase family protein n=1 Tax=Thalassobacillus sp. B23F22_16 TaxID=3459513 RepID=UPI00373EB72C